MVSDELIISALVESLEERLTQYKIWGEENPRRFSLAYKIRKKSIIRLANRYENQGRQADRKYMPLRRLAMLIAIIIAAVVLSVGIFAAYTIINNFVFDVHDDHSDVTLDPSAYELKDAIAELYWLPPESGCEYIDDMNDGEVAFYDYSLNNNAVKLAQYTRFFAEQALVINTEHSDVFGVKINGNDGFMVIHHREGFEDSKTITWVMDGYIFQITSTTISNDALMELAESVIMKKDLE